MLGFIAEGGPEGRLAENYEAFCCIPHPCETIGVRPGWCCRTCSSLAGGWSLSMFAKDPVELLSLSVSLSLSLSLSCSEKDPGVSTSAATQQRRQVSGPGPVSVRQQACPKATRQNCRIIRFVYAGPNLDDVSPFPWFPSLLHQPSGENCEGFRLELEGLKSVSCSDILVAFQGIMDSRSDLGIYVLTSKDGIKVHIIFTRVLSPGHEISTRVFGSSEV